MYFWLLLMKLGLCFSLQRIVKERVRALNLGMVSLGAHEPGKARMRARGEARDEQKQSNLCNLMKPL